MDLHYQNFTEFQAAARQLGTFCLSTKASKPFDLNFFFDVDFIRCTIALGLIPGIDKYQSISDSETTSLSRQREILNSYNHNLFPSKIPSERGTSNEHAKSEPILYIEEPIHLLPHLVT